MFPKPTSTAPHKFPNRRVLSGRCPDTTLRIRENFVILHYPGNDPGKKYEIKSENDLVRNWEGPLDKGTTVIVKFGHASLQGTVLFVSENRTEVQLNFNRVVKEHEKEYAEILMMDDDSDDMDVVIFTPPVRLVDQITQTEIDTFTVIHTQATYAAYNMLKRQHELLKSKYERLKSRYERLKSRLNPTGAGAIDLDAGDRMSLSPELPEVDHGNISPIISSPSRASYEVREVMVNPFNNVDENIDPFNGSIQIGLAGTKIPMRTFDTIDWQNYATATGGVLEVLFPKIVLATHTPMDRYNRLNPIIVSDIVELVSSECKIAKSYVENAIMTKCIEESMAYYRESQYQQNSLLELEAFVNGDQNSPYYPVFNI